jgi:hypothetical protein
MTKLQLQIVVADLIQEAIDYGVPYKQIYQILRRNGFGKTDILVFYGITEGEQNDNS